MRETRQIFSWRWSGQDPKSGFRPTDTHSHCCLHRLQQHRDTAVSRQGPRGCFAVSKQSDMSWNHTVAAERKGLKVSRERRVRLRLKTLPGLAAVLSGHMVIGKALSEDAGTLQEAALGAWG